jgi:2-(3-amino-3-carboxypropyl)histidine synthase
MGSMDTIFLEAEYKGKVDTGIINKDKLPGRIGLVAAVQFAAHLDKIRSALSGKKVYIAKAKQKHPGQILGCDASSAEAIKDKVDAFLYVGTGKFHPIVVAVSTGKDVFLFNPVSRIFSKLDKKEIAGYKRRKKASLIRFLDAKNIGILVSIKKGQYYDIRELKALDKKYPEKRFYVFIAETIDYTQLENFNFIDAWLNTACPRIEEDIKVANISDIINIP